MNSAVGVENSLRKKIELEGLKIWFENEKRDLPWRREITPYRVWVSEIMLQQTQAVVVIPYFEKWMACFPTIQALADAPFDQVVKLWEGLGYYARVRHLHEAAKWIVKEHQGNLPTTEEELAKVKGLGFYTIGAIRSFAFHQKAAAVDGNVARVLARLLLIEKEIDLPIVQKALREKCFELLPDFEPWVLMEAFIELGAQICKKIPLCMKCPLQSECLAYQQGREGQLPRRKKKVSITLLHRTVAVIAYEGELLLKQEREKRVMQGLYEFPYFEGEEVNVSREVPFALEFVKQLACVEHGFTRYRALLFPTVWKTKKRVELESFQWIKREQLEQLPFSAGHRQILKEYLKTISI